MCKKIKLAVVDDHPIVVQGIVSLLESLNDIEVVGSFYTGTDLLTFLKDSHLDMVLIDVMLPDINGIELCA